MNQTKPSSHRFQLSTDLSGRIASLASDLLGEADDHQGEWDERAERWQEGDKGIAVAAWIESLRELAEALEAFSDEP